MAATEVLEPLTLSSGVVLPNRIAMAPMLVSGSEAGTGHAADEDIAYFEARAGVAGMLISGASSVSREGRGLERELSNADDSDLEGLTRVAAAMKQKGNVAIEQIYHTGREAKSGAAEFGTAQVPSTQDFPWLSYGTHGMSSDEVQDVIAAFGAATRRAIAAGFDGVEIHGANHYLIQQFFSAFSNHRDDEWGGDLERRMAFPLAVLAEVKRAAAEAGRPFAVGYRLCMDEIHGDNVGYTVKESSVLVDRIAAAGVDYIHVSLFTGYDDAPTGSDESYGQIAKRVVAGRCPVVIVSDIATAAQAEAALSHGDIVAIGRAALVEPAFADKIASGRAEDIETSVAGRLETLAWPEGLVETYAGPLGKNLPPVTGLAPYLAGRGE